MGFANHASVTLVTGACGHVGRELCRLLTDAGRKILPLDVNADKRRDIVTCDLRSPSDLSQLFEAHPIREVIHLAGILPSAFRADPLTGADVNLGGSCALMRQAAVAHVKRFIFASSMSVYGSSRTGRPVTEDHPPAPDEPYGASKLAVELIGQALAKEKTFEFVSLRIARVVGPGIRKTSSAWRAKIFEASPQLQSVTVPFAPEALLSLVHVEDVARMLLTLAETPGMSGPIYNTPVEIWKAKHLKEVIEEVRGIRVELGPPAAHGGPICDGSRFAREFGFQIKGLRDHLSSRARSNLASLA